MLLNTELLRMRASPTAGSTCKTKVFARPSFNKAIVKGDVHTDDQDYHNNGAFRNAAPGCSSAGIVAG